MSLHPAEAGLPVTTRTDRILLRPLLTTDVEIDYEAVMASAEQLRMWSDSEWPADDFGLSGNLADLQMHQDAHEQGEAYTYTVLSPEADRCLGCVYFYPLAAAMQQACGSAAAGVVVRFWVRTSEIAHELDAHLLATLRTWLAEKWVYDCIVYPINPLDVRQASLLRAAGCELRLVYTRANGRPWHVYG